MTKLRSETITAGGRRLHYLEAGEGLPVLLLHGWPSNAQLWRYVVPEVGRTRRAIALDLPGFGGSDKPTDVRYSFRFFEETIDAFLDALGIDRLGLAVHDLGGPIGLYWAARHLERVTDVAILNTLVFPETSWAVKAFLLSLNVPGLSHWLASPRGVEMSMRFGVVNRANIDAETARLYSAPYASAEARRALILAGKGLSIRGLSTIAQALPEFKMPVRGLYGERDRILPDIAKTMGRIQASIPHAEVTSLQNCGHFLQEDLRQEVAASLAEFFSRQTMEG